ncbi:MAG TPA: DUF58 domain-containing protein [bacterium]|nr:DUF58 domain-containing protein [bacterium]
MTTAATLLDAQFLRRLDRLGLRSRRITRGLLRGERRSPRQGRGVEFADYRSYQIGDDFRYVDWNIYSRLDRLFIKLFSEEEDINVHLFVDGSRSMGWGTPDKLGYAVRLAAAVGYVGLRNLDRVGAVVFSDGPQRVLPLHRGRGHILQLFEFLSQVEPRGISDLGATMRRYVYQTKRRGLLIVISDLWLPGGYEEGLKLARFHRFEPFVIHVVSDDELTPGVRGDVNLVDVESAASVDVSVDGHALEAYGRARDAYFAGIERFCLRQQIDYLRASTSIPFDDLVLRYLRIGGLLA